MNYTATIFTLLVWFTVASQANNVPAKWSLYHTDVQQRGYNQMANVGSNSITDDDREAFFELLNKLLWNEEEDDDEDDGSGRQFLRRRGLLNRPMPLYLTRQDTGGGSLYRSFSDGCASFFCKLGLGGLASSINRMLS